MTKTAKTYGGALYDLAKEEALCEGLLGQLQVIAAVFEETPEYRKLLLEPSIPKEERRKLLDDAWQGRVHPYVLNFLKILTEKGYMRYYSRPHHYGRGNRIAWQN